MNGNAEKKPNRKGTVIAICVFVLMIPGVALLMRIFASETVITHIPVDLNGTKRCIILSEKTGSKNNQNKNNLHNGEIGTTHFGYFLELYDSTTNTSLDKIAIDAPVKHIQHQPELRVFSDGTIWMISTTTSADEDRRGFILKFVVDKSKILMKDFDLDKKYKIYNLNGNAVVMGENNDFAGVYGDTVFGCVYLDLETGKMIDTRKH